MIIIDSRVEPVQKEFYTSTPYYKGVVTYQEVQYPGLHQPLVDEPTWEKVQTVLNQNRNGERTRIHNNHLKGIIRCGHCGSRLIVQNTKSRNGDIYAYFVCIGRQRNHASCHFKAVLIEETQQRITDIYKTIHISQELRDVVQHQLMILLDEIYSHQKQQLAELAATKNRLQAEQAKLLQAHYADAIPLDILKQEQARISGQLAGIDHQTLTLNADKTKVADHLDFALNLLQDCYRLYTTSPDHLKKLLNNVFFEKILINPQDDPDTTTIQRTATPTLAPPFDNLVSIAQQKASEDHSSEAPRSNIAAIVSSKTFVVALLDIDSKIIAALTRQMNELKKCPLPHETPHASAPRTRGLRRSNLSQEQIQQVLEQYRQKVAVKTICQTFGISRDYLNALRHEHRQPIRQKSITDDELKVAIHLYRQGQSLANVAKQFNISAETLRQKFIKANVILRPRNGWTASK